MLYEFVDLNRNLLISRTRERVRSRPWPSVAPGEVEHGLPPFLTQPSEALRLEATSVSVPMDAISVAALATGGRRDRRVRNVALFIIDLPLAAEESAPRPVS